MGLRDSWTPRSGTAETLLALAVRTQKSIERRSLGHLGISLQSYPPRTMTDLAPSEPGGSPAIALTFDDGPDPATTPQILDILKAASVRASFFLCGEPSSREPALVRRIAVEGHVVGAHTWSHVSLPTIRGADWAHQVHRTRLLLQELSGQPVVYMRPPWGQLDATSLAALARAGLVPMLWSVDPQDWRQSSPQAILHHVLERAEPGCVVLLHDGVGDRFSGLGGLPAGSAGDRQATVDSLKAILDALFARGLLPVPLPLSPPEIPRRWSWLRSGGRLIERGPRAASR
jgi:peptidoglycan/xylan/chitin deacetylase (PgdA/CDA1 family)